MHNQRRRPLLLLACCWCHVLSDDDVGVNGVVVGAAAAAAADVDVDWRHIMISSGKFPHCDRWPEHAMSWAQLAFVARERAPRLTQAPLTIVGASSRQDEGLRRARVRPAGRPRARDHFSAISARSNAQNSPRPCQAWAGVNLFPLQNKSVLAQQLDHCRLLSGREPVRLAAAAARRGSRQKVANNEAHLARTRAPALRAPPRPRPQIIRPLMTFIERHPDGCSCSEPATGRPWPAPLESLSELIGREAGAGRPMGRPARRVQSSSRPRSVAS